MVVRQKNQGPDEKFRKRFAFTDKEKEGALRHGKGCSASLTLQDVERSAAIVHELIYPATEDNPLSIVDVFQRFDDPSVENVMASYLLAMAYPRWKAEGKVGEKTGEGTHTSMSASTDSHAGTHIRTDDCYMWLILEDE